MFSEIGPVEVYCDAPPYEVVKACEQCDFQNPLDVRWCRTNLKVDGISRRSGILGIRPLGWLFGWSESQKDACICGAPMPEMNGYEFRSNSGEASGFILGQCRQCHTISWDVPRPPSGWMD